MLFSEYIRKLDREKRETLMSEQYWSGTPDKSPDQDAYEAAEAGTEEVSGTYRAAVHGVLALPKNIRQMGHPGQSHVVYIEDYV